MLRQCSRTAVQRIKRSLVTSASRPRSYARSYGSTPSRSLTQSMLGPRALEVSHRRRLGGRLMSTAAQQQQQSSSSSSASASSMLSTILKTLAGAGVVGVAGLAYNHYEANQEQARFEATLTPLEPPEAFRHPYDDRPWYWRSLFRAKRMLELFFVWAPCATVAMIASFTESEEWRKYMLDVLVRTLERAGCTFQKFGQWLSMRPDIFKPDVIEALATLRDHAPQHEYKHTRAMIKESFGMELEELFESFDVEPVASGTVAQVHRGTLRQDAAELANIRGPDGELVREVAIKVRHPHVLGETWMDLELLFGFVNNSKYLVIPFRQEDFSMVMQKQLDFNWEAHNLQKFARNFHSEIKEGRVFFPTVSTELLSPSILIESWAKGTTVSNIFSEVGDNFQELVDDVGGMAREFGDSIKATKKELARTVFDMNMKMFLRDNLVHGDLHGGNILYSENSSTCTVIDAGLTTSIGNDVKAQFGDFLHALCTGNTERMVEKLMQFGERKEEDSQEGTEAYEMKREAFRTDLAACLAEYIDVEGGATAPDGSPISLGDVMGQLVFALQRHDIELRGDVAASIMTMSVSEGLIRSLDPNFDVVRMSLPYFVRFNGWSSVDAVLDHSKQQDE